MKLNGAFSKAAQKVDTITSKQHRGIRLDKTLSSPEFQPRKVATNFTKKLAKPAKKRGSTCKSNFSEDIAEPRDSPRASNCYSELYLGLSKKETEAKSVSAAAAAAPASASEDRGDAAAHPGSPNAIRESKRPSALEAAELCEKYKSTQRELADYRTTARGLQRLLGGEDVDGVCLQLNATELVERLVSAHVEKREWAHASSQSSPGAGCCDVPAGSAAAAGEGEAAGGAREGGESGEELARRLCESYDMQEKLVAENGDLESKRYILHKELMSKDRQLEMQRGYVGRLQGELKIISKENALLLERVQKNHPEGLGAVNEERVSQSELQDLLQQYNVKNAALVRQLEVMEGEMRAIQEELKGRHACRGGAHGASCYDQSKNGLNMPPHSKDCGLCPPCPGTCNPNAPPTPAEREVAVLSVKLRNLEENFKLKIAECAMLRGESVKQREELERERSGRRETESRFRELEIKFQGLATHTNMMLGSKEQAIEQETSVRTLKQCYREAKEEIDELRILVKEQEEQLMDYRAKYMQAQQLVEEQRRQMDMLDMDNTRISEQINLEIQRVKLKFQEKLQELAPLPAILKATQTRLKETQETQAISEHNAESLARELNAAREKIHLMLHNTTKQPEMKNENKSVVDEKQIQLLQSRIQQLTEANASLKAEQERLKANVIRQEEAVLANEKRLHEKMHECAQLGGELERAREEAAQAVARACERTDTVRKCMQTSVAELERQIAAARAQQLNSSKQHEEERMRMRCQVVRLSESLEQAHERIAGLHEQTARAASAGGAAGAAAGAEDDDEPGQCTCRSFFG